MNVPISEARDRFSELVNQTAFGKQRHILQRRGKPVAAIVPIEDLEKIDNSHNDVRQSYKEEE